MLLQTYKEFAVFRNNLAQVKDINQRPQITIAIIWFWKRAKLSIKFIFTEKEALFLLCIQWVVIVLTYLLWVQIIAIIPEELWGNTDWSSQKNTLIVILLWWSFLCIWIASFIIGILSSCVWVLYLLKKRTWSSDLYTSFTVVLPHSLLIWIFSWIDGWWTMRRIAQRISRFSRKRPGSFLSNVMKEVTYYAWKVGTIWILPALATGKTVWSAIKTSLSLVNVCRTDVIITRAWYSIMCWVVWTAGFIWFIYMFNYVGIINDASSDVENMYSFYMYATIPISISVGIVLLLLRPIYIISSFAIYENFLAFIWEDLVLWDVLLDEK